MAVIYLGLFSTILFMMLAELLYPARSQKNLLAHNLRNLALGYTWFLSFSFLPILSNFSYLIIWPRPFMDWKLVMVIGIIILDFSTYWWHRFNHSNSFFRKVHWIHHSDLNVNFSTTLRFHYIELAVYYFYKLALCSILQIPIVVLLTYDSLTYSSGMFHHSNIKLNPWLEKILSPFIVTPSFHFNHHSAELKYANSNYGSFLTIWDRIFGTYTIPQSHVKIGSDAADGKSFIGLWIYPFKRKT